ncbi:MAG: methyltransferase domain-containing protein [Candidatus Omnitrophica bacterium]|nr:methyltransferase domain-containing protein [Candidatus Omnitrophota bacterium]
MGKETIFDRYGAITEGRKVFLDSLVPELVESCGLKTALDVGCGVGAFSKSLAGYGLGVAALDARAENIAEAKTRHPEILFSRADVESADVLKFPPADFVLCFGLLYHLENPFRAVRHLAALTNKIMVVESMTIPYALPFAMLYEEPRQEDQSLDYIAFVLSESCLVKMLYRAGFMAVYLPEKLPNHGHFKESSKERKMRSVLVASKIKIKKEVLRLVPEPGTVNVWRKPKNLFSSFFK